jgi:hypothetical protein
VSGAIKPTQRPARAEVQRLLDSVSLVGEKNNLPAAWVRVVSTTWTRAAAAIMAGKTAESNALGAIALVLARAGANACAAATDETEAWERYRWMRAGRAHRNAAAAILVGWPPERSTIKGLPTEFNNLRDRASKSFIADPGDTRIQTLIADPLAITSKAEAIASLAVIAANVRLDGL